MIKCLIQSISVKLCLVLKIRVKVVCDTNAVVLILRISVKVMPHNKVCLIHRMSVKLCLILRISVDVVPDTKE